MQPPARPGRQLLRFRAGEQVAEIERVEEIFFSDPFAFVHQFAVHQRDLPGRPAKAEEADAGKHPHKIGKRNGWGHASHSHTYLAKKPCCQSKGARQRLGWL